ncbi:MAG: sulfite exporter TauE/SafE family protein, partial [Nanoarchaeota archaeon]|nr:sulfite exporter TauE/SafE family protein [Nanoarchaeota archaeon]
KEQVKKIKGVKTIDFSYETEKGKITYDDKKTNIKKIFTKIEEKGYNCKLIDKEENKKTFGWIFGILGIIIIGYFLLKLTDGINTPQISQNMSYGLLFIVGLLTGFHCIAMCGGFVVSYTAKAAKEKNNLYKSHLMYATGKTLSYTIIGAAFGLLGSIIAFTPIMKGIAGIIAGLFLLIFGINMLNLIPALRKIRIKTPQFINRFAGKKSKENNTPLIIGLLNGLMIACGPLQAIYIMAAGTGSMIEGAKLLFIFAIGTLPVMLGFGFLTSIISNKATNKILKASGAIVIILGIIMINRGLTLTGTGLDANTIIASVTATSTTTTAMNNGIEILEGYQIIKMNVTRYGWEPDKFVLKKDVPVKWIITGKEITSCNNAIQVPKYGLRFDIKLGEQIIEFTPTQEGIISWSCWMGMIPGTFIVKEDINLNDAKSIEEELNTISVQNTDSYREASSGGCGCGGR